MSMIVDKGLSSYEKLFFFFFFILLLLFMIEVNINIEYNGWKKNKYIYLFFNKFMFIFY
jgi:1-acyl-sn-glycerol-3-phosphate acyltransferase